MDLIIFCIDCGVEFVVIDSIDVGVGKMFEELCYCYLY